MSSISPMLALMLGLAVGIDYSLFIVNRHRTSCSPAWTLRNPWPAPPERQATPCSLPA